MKRSGCAGTLRNLATLCSVIGLFCLAGCESFQRHLRLQSPEQEPESDEFETEVKTPLIGDYVTFGGLNLVTLEGVGLVTGLDGTGGDPPPSAYRTRLYQEMKRRDVVNPNEILRSPNTALVIVRAYLPPLIRKGEHFDVEVRVPEGSDTTSLNGGWLLETPLAEQAIVPGQGVLQGHIFAKGEGPILISTGEGADKESLAGVLRRGRILGGGISRRERDLTIYLRNDFRSVRNSRRIAERIGKRFHAYNGHGIKEPLAEAKTDQTIVLKVPRRYKDNYPRYLQVIRSIPFRETTVARRLRLNRLESELSMPEKAEKAALQLEAIGAEAIPTLKAALDNSNLEVRFHAAMALAYLEQTEGLKVLAEAARDERAFRVYALAGLASVDDSESIMLLRDLLNSQQNENGEDSGSAELRYGAFRALRTLDRNDPVVHGEQMNEQFNLHVLNVTGDPMTHLTHRRNAEIVLFGANQEFLTPMAVRAGNHVLVTASPGSQTVTVSRYEIGHEDQRRTVSRRIADVIRTAAEFGASYPDVAQMLIQADRQHNIDSRLAIDALPRAGRVYYRESATGKSTPTRTGRSHNAPNLFFTGGGEKSNTPSDDSDSPAAHPEEDSGTATLADARTASAEPTEEEHRWYDILKSTHWPGIGRASTSEAGE